jgi:hypothetical protein
MRLDGASLHGLILGRIVGTRNMMLATTTRWGICTNCLFIAKSRALVATFSAAGESPAGHLSSQVFTSASSNRKTGVCARSTDPLAVTSALTPLGQHPCIWTRARRPLFPEGQTPCSMALEAAHQQPRQTHTSGAWGQDRASLRAAVGLVTPGINEWNVSLFKRTTVKEGHVLEFRSEFYNALNHANFLAPDVNIGSPTFGIVTQTRDPRIIQMVLKYEF